MRMFSTSLPFKIIRNPIANDQLALLENELPKTPAPECYFPETIKKQENPLQLASKNGINYSSIKLNACAKIVRKKHVYDALHLIMQT